MTSMGGVSTEFFCAYCSRNPRNPCHSAEEVAVCGNAPSYSKEHARSLLPGYSQDEVDELAEYRERYGPLR